MRLTLKTKLVILLYVSPYMYMYLPFIHAVLIFFGNDSCNDHCRPVAGGGGGGGGQGGHLTPPQNNERSTFLLIIIIFFIFNLFLSSLPLSLYELNLVVK